jgi:hypothetical protein
MVKNLSILLFLCFTSIVYGQESNYKVACIAFYNVENLFDTEDDPTIRDEEYTPDGSRAWTEERYQEKLGNMAYAISQIGTELSPTGASIIGLSEVENRKVLEDLVNHPLLEKRHYKIVHQDSPDFRGIDVALLYKDEHFKLDTFKLIPLPNYNSDGSLRRTREILYVEGELDNDKMHFLVNHWPSRRGGQSKTATYRNKGAKICREVIDSLTQIDINAKVFVMGDLNDDPSDESVKSFLRAKYKKEDVKAGDVFNPMNDFYRRGIGSNAYRDAWSLFDQIMFTSGVVDKDQEGYFHYKTIIFNKKFLIQRSGQYKGYPFRTFGGMEYKGGYSDHFPVFVYLAKKV